MRSWEELSKVEQLQDTFSDFYKDVHGFRPRWMTTEQWNSEAWLEEAIKDLHRWCSTPEYQAQQEAEEIYFREQEEQSHQEMTQIQEDAQLLAPWTAAEYAQHAADLDCAHYGMKG